MVENAWKTDAKGRYISLYQGARKDYSPDWTDWLGGDTLSTAVLTVGSGVTQAGNCEIAGGVVKFILVAGGATAEVACSLKITSAAGNIEFLKFRVKVL